MSRVVPGALARTQGVLSDDIVRHLERRIVSGGLQPGERLPPERELAAELGVSRNALREALMRLQAAGLVERRQGSGTRVSRSAPVAVTIAASLSGGVSDLVYSAELREVLEPQVAGLAAARISPAEVEDLRRLVEESGAALAGGDVIAPERSVQLDLDFHMGVARAARNPLLASLCELAATWTVEARVHSHISGLGRRLSHEGHLRILDALERHDAVAARATMAGHLREIGALIEAEHAASPT